MQEQHQSVSPLLLWTTVRDCTVTPSELFSLNPVLTGVLFDLSAPPRLFSFAFIHTYVKVRY